MNVGKVAFSGDTDYTFLNQRITVLEEEMDRIKSRLPAIFEQPNFDWNEVGYTPKQLRKVIPRKWMKEFMKFMVGQTIGVNDDTQPVYYKCDVEKFLKLKETGKRMSYLEWD
jgi:hypothetical protein